MAALCIFHLSSMHLRLTFADISSPWAQSYDPLHNWGLSTLLASLPLLALLIALLGPRLKAHYASLVALAVALVVAVGVFHMPTHLAVLSAIYGAAYGLFPIFWIIFPVIFLYHLTIKARRFGLLQDSLVGVTQDSRLQLLLIAFAFGAFFEGASGFGTPVAVCGTILMGLGFSPLRAAGLALLANTAPVAFGALGTPVIALHGVTGLDTFVLTRVVAGLLTPFCILVPFWLIWAFAGFKRMIEVWPAILVTGVTFGFTQLLMARLHGPWLVDITASIVTIGLLILFLHIWKPKEVLNADLQVVPALDHLPNNNSFASVRRAALPWLILAIFVTIWGTPHITAWLGSGTTLHPVVQGLHDAVLRMPPASHLPTAEPAIFTFNWLSATGTGIFISAILSAFLMGLKPRDIFQSLWHTIVTTRFTAITIAALMALGFVTRFCGLDATLGLAFARTGVLYPIFGTLIGWLGTASTGSDTSSNVLFGSLQTVTAQQLNISPYLMAAANSGGGVMGKMVAPQSIVVATTATESYGKEGTIMRFVLMHSLGLAFLMGLLVLFAVHTPKFANMLLH